MSGFNASGRDDALSRRSVGLDSLSSSPVLPMIAALFFVLTFLIKALVDDAFTRGDISAGIAYTKYVTALSPAWRRWHMLLRTASECSSKSSTPLLSSSLFHGGVHFSAG